MRTIPDPVFTAATLQALAHDAERLETDGGLVWRRWGAGPAVVLLHGSAGSWTHWARCIPVLARARTVYAPDIPGLGDSAALAAPVTLQALGAALAQGISRIAGAGEPLDLVGFSFGTAVAGEVALACAPAVRTLTLVAPSAMGLPKTSARLHDWRAATDEAGARAIHRQNLAALMFADASKIDEVAVDLQVANAVRARLKSRPLTPPDALLPVFDAVPVQRIHVIIGEKDVVAASHMRERERFFGERLPAGHFHRIADAGHWVAHEAPGALLGVLARILALP